MVHAIAKRKRAEEALLESEERYATTLTIIGDAVIANGIYRMIVILSSIH